MALCSFLCVNNINNLRLFPSFPHLLCSYSSNNRYLLLKSMLPSIYSHFVRRSSNAYNMNWQDYYRKIHIRQVFLLIEGSCCTTIHTYLTFNKACRCVEVLLPNSMYCITRLLYWLRVSQLSVWVSCFYVLIFLLQLHSAWHILLIVILLFIFYVQQHDKSIQQMIEF